MQYYMETILYGYFRHYDADSWALQLILNCYRTIERRLYLSVYDLNINCQIHIKLLKTFVNKT